MVSYHSAKFHSRIVYEVEQRVKFLKTGKYDQDFQAGDYGVVEKVLSPFPSATDTIYLIVHEKTGELMWATGEDIIAFNQTTIDEEFAKTLAGKQKVMCDSFYDEGELVPCIRSYNHHGWHKADGGLTWPDRRPVKVPNATWIDDDDPYRVMSLNGFEHPFRNRYY